MTNNDFDFIKNKFDNDGVSAPDSISEDAIAKKLPSKAKIRFFEKQSFKKAVSLASCFAVLIGIMSFALPKANPLVSYGINHSDVKTAEIKAFDNYSSLKDNINNYITVQSFKNILSFTSLTVGGVADGNWGKSFGETYVQVEGIDEADILKNDGKYIYYLNEHNTIFIYEGDRLVTEITDFRSTSEYNYDDSYSESVEDMFVADNKLIVNTYSCYDKEMNGYSVGNFTNSYIYDLSDISSPELLKKFTNSGGYNSSRLIGDMLYIVSNKYVGLGKNDYSEEDCYIYYGEDDEMTVLPANSIMYGESIESSECIILSAININKLKRTADTKAFFGCSSDVYCNHNNMYVSSWGADSQLVKIEFNENEIKFAASVTLNGYIHNQFSMNESDGYLRVATTDQNGNNLFVLDNQLNLVGSVTGFAEGEEIKSVNYIGDMAYVITYEEIDPLFAIDVSDPENPVIKGSMEITGFSSQLVPIDENTLLGIGRDNGVKLVLFDISNPAELKAFDSYVIADSFSETQWNHKAITINKEKNYFAIDYFENDDYGHALKSSVLVFNTDNNKINIINDYQVDVSNSDEDICYSVKRTTYIGDTLYALDSEGSIYSFDM